MLEFVAALHNITTLYLKPIHNATSFEKIDQHSKDRQNAHNDKEIQNPLDGGIKPRYPASGFSIAFFLLFQGLGETVFNDTDLGSGIEQHRRELFYIAFQRVEPH